LKIIFGLDLDGYQDSGTRDRFNELTCGPSGFLRLLELRLGLMSNPASAAVRVAQYRNLLENAASTKPRFYTESFGKDGFATAETLLQWRDELILAGWNGLAGPNHDARLRDLAAVERMAEATLSPGFGERVRLILIELDRRDAKLGRVEVVEHREYIPLLLRKLLVKLGAGFRDTGWISKPASIPGTDLWKIQKALASSGETTQIKLAYDGTVIFVIAYSEVTHANRKRTCSQGSECRGRSRGVAFALCGLYPSTRHACAGYSGRSSQRMARAAAGAVAQTTRSWQ